MVPATKNYSVVTPLTGMVLPSAPTSRQPDQLPMLEWFSSTCSQTSARTILTAAPVSIMNRRGFPNNKIRMGRAYLQQFYNIVIAYIIKCYIRVKMGLLLLSTLRHLTHDAEGF